MASTSDFYSATPNDWAIEDMKAATLEQNSNPTFVRRQSQSQGVPTPYELPAEGPAVLFAQLSARVAEQTVCTEEARARLRAYHSHRMWKRVRLLLIGMHDSVSLTRNLNVNIIQRIFWYMQPTSLPDSCKPAPWNTFTIGPG